MSNSYLFLSRNNCNMLDNYDVWCDEWKFHALIGDADYFLKNNQKSVDDFGMTPLMWFIVGDTSIFYEDKCRQMAKTSDITAQNIMGHTARDIFLILSQSNYETNFFDIINYGSKPRTTRLFGSLEDFEKDEIAWKHIRSQSMQLRREQDVNLKREATIINTLSNSYALLEKEKNDIKNMQYDNIVQQLKTGKENYIKEIYLRNPKDEFETTKEYEDRIHTFLNNTLQKKKVNGYDTELPIEYAQQILLTCEQQMSDKLSKLDSSFQQKMSFAQESQSLKTKLFSEYICPTYKFEWGQYNADDEILSFYFGELNFSIKIDREKAKQLKLSRIPYDIYKNISFSFSPDFCCDITLTLITDIGEFKSSETKVQLFECCNEI